MARLRIDRDLLWRKLLAFDQHESAFQSDDVAEMVRALVVQNQQAPLRAMLLQRIGYWLRADVVPLFWRFFDNHAQLLQRSARTARGRREFTLYCAEQLALAMEFAQEALAQCVQLASIFDDLGQASAKSGPSMLEEIKANFRCLVFENYASKQLFQEILIVFFSMSFQRFRGTEKFQAFDAQPIRELLMQLEWMRLAEPAMMNVLESQIRKTIQSMGGDELCEPLLNQVEDWACAELLPWIDEVLQTDGDAATSHKWKEVLSYRVVEEFGNLRISQLFDIMKELPDSIPALEDLKSCLERTNQHQQLVKEFRDALQTRLLQPGANTSSILDIYVSTIKAFHILDPKGVLLEALSEPVKEYLRNRKDTVRCIVKSLTDEQQGELFEELRRNNLRIIQQDDDSDDDEDISPDDWEPDPIEADPTKSSRSRSSDDILRILVSIYGSRELFVHEYRMMLGDKLLQNLDYNTDQDVQTLELLKLRFGEDNLQQCEIMVRDIEDSKRINANVRSSLEETVSSEANDVPTFPVDATVVSSEFWPPFQGDEFALHPKTTHAIDEFKKAYHVSRTPRTLAWNPALGSVQLSIELEGVERDFTVSPIQATIMMHFEDQDTWAVEDLSAKMEVSEDVLCKHVSIWVNHGVLLFPPDRKKLIAAKRFEESQYGARGSLMDEREAAVSSDAQQEEDLKVLETYIVGMLANFGSLGIQRIHNMLSTFARSGAQPYDKPISGLSVILNKLVERGTLDLAGSNYQLARK